MAGSYSTIVTVKDTKTGLSGQGTYTVTIAAAVIAPVVTGAAVSGNTGVGLTFQAAVSAANPVTFTLIGAPSGMTVSPSGAVTWAVPVVGSYSVTVVAKDTKTALSGQGVYAVTIATVVKVPVGPTITAAQINGVVGKPVSGTITIADVGATNIQVSITGVPMGMMFASNGQTLTASWASPVAGTYNLVVKAVDNLGRSATATIPVTISR